LHKFFFQYVDGSEGSVTSVVKLFKKLEGPPGLLEKFYHRGHREGTEITEPSDSSKFLK